MSMHGLYFCLSEFFLLYFFHCWESPLIFAKLMQRVTCKDATLQGPSEHLPLNNFK
jgi:hypothetical protein